MTYILLVFTRLVSTIEQFTDNVAVPPAVTSLTVSRSGIAVHVFDVPLSNDEDVHQNLVYGMGLGRRESTGADNDVEFYRFPVTLDDILAGRNGLVDGAILLSRDVLDIGRGHHGEDRKYTYALLAEALD